LQPYQLLLSKSKLATKKVKKPAKKKPKKR
jgi:hypothetical protein